MKVGDIVRPKQKFTQFVPFSTVLGQSREWVGIIIDFDQGDPIVFWDRDFHSEIEYVHQLEVVNASR